MTDEFTYAEALSTWELDSQHGEWLPARRVMALLNINAIVAANTAAAVNAATVNSAATAFAAQAIFVSQS
jgi:hypothetical protein